MKRRNFLKVIIGTVVAGATGKSIASTETVIIPQSDRAIPMPGVQYTFNPKHINTGLAMTPRPDTGWEVLNITPNDIFHPVYHHTGPKPCGKIAMYATKQFKRGDPVRHTDFVATDMTPMKRSGKCGSCGGAIGPLGDKCLRGMDERFDEARRIKAELGPYWEAYNAAKRG